MKKKTLATIVFGSMIAAGSVLYFNATSIKGLDSIGLVDPTIKDISLIGTGDVVALDPRFEPLVNFYGAQWELNKMENLGADRLDYLLGVYSNQVIEEKNFLGLIFGKNSLKSLEQSKIALVPGVFFSHLSQEKIGQRLERQDLYDDVLKGHDIGDNIAERFAAVGFKWESQVHGVMAMRHTLALQDLIQKYGTNVVEIFKRFYFYSVLKGKEAQIIYPLDGFNGSLQMAVNGTRQMQIGNVTDFHTLVNADFLREHWGAFNVLFDSSKVALVRYYGRAGLMEAILLPIGDENFLLYSQKGVFEVVNKDILVARVLSVQFLHYKVIGGLFKDNFAVNFITNGVTRELGLFPLHLKDALNFKAIVAMLKKDGAKLARFKKGDIFELINEKGEVIRFDALSGRLVANEISK